MSLGRISLSGGVPSSSLGQHAGGAEDRLAPCHINRNDVTSRRLHQQASLPSPEELEASATADTANSHSHSSSQIPVLRSASSAPQTNWSFSGGDISDHYTSLHIPLLGDSRGSSDYGAGAAKSAAATATAATAGTGAAAALTAAHAADYTDRYVMLCLLGYSMAFIVFGSQVSILGPTIQGLAANLKVADVDLSPLFTALGVSCIISGTPSGWVVDRYPSHYVLIGSLLVEAIGFALVPIMPSVASLTALYFTICLSYNFTNSAVFTSLGWLFPQRMGPGINLVLAMFGVGSFCIPLMAQACSHYLGDPVLVFRFVAGFSLLSAIPFCFVASPTRPTSSTVSAAQAAAAAAALAAAAVAAEEGTGEGGDEAELSQALGAIDEEQGKESMQEQGLQRRAGSLRTIATVTVICLVFMTTAAETAIGNWLNSYGLKAVGLSDAQAAVSNSAFWGAFTAGRVLAAFLSHATTPATLLLGSIPFAIIGCALPLIAGLPHMNYGLVLVLASLTGFGNSTTYANAVALLERYVPVTGFLNGVFGAVAGGACMVGPVLVASLVAHTSIGYQAMAWVGLCLYALHIPAILLTLTCGSRLRRIAAQLSALDIAASSNDEKPGRLTPKKTPRSGVHGKHGANGEASEPLLSRHSVDGGGMINGAVGHESERPSFQFNHGDSALYSTTRSGGGGGGGGWSRRSTDDGRSSATGHLPPSHYIASLPPLVGAVLPDDDDAGSITHPPLPQHTVSLLAPVRTIVPSVSGTSNGEGPRDHTSHAHGDGLSGLNHPGGNALDHNHITGMQGCFDFFMQGGAPAEAGERGVPNMQTLAAHIKSPDAAWLRSSGPATTAHVAASMHSSSNASLEAGQSRRFDNGVNAPAARQSQVGNAGAAQSNSSSSRHGVLSGPLTHGLTGSSRSAGTDSITNSSGSRHGSSSRRDATAATSAGGSMTGSRRISEQKLAALTAHAHDRTTETRRSSRELLRNKPVIHVSPSSATSMPAPAVTGLPSAGSNGSSMPDTPVMASEEFNSFSFVDAGLGLLYDHAGVATAKATGPTPAFANLLD